MAQWFLSGLQHTPCTMERELSEIVGKFLGGYVEILSPHFGADSRF